MGVYTLINERSHEIEALCRKHYVRRLALFGSAMREDFNAERSDVDLLVDFTEMPPAQYARNYFALLNAFTALFGRNVELVSWESIKNPYFLREVEATHQLLYAA